MARYKRFTFLCNSNERRILDALARRLQRSQSDSVRWLIRNAAQELETQLAELTQADTPIPLAEIAEAVSEHAA